MSELFESIDRAEPDDTPPSKPRVVELDRVRSELTPTQITALVESVNFQIHSLSERARGEDLCGAPLRRARSQTVEVLVQKGLCEVGASASAPARVTLTAAGARIGEALWRETHPARSAAEAVRRRRREIRELQRAQQLQSQICDQIQSAGSRALSAEMRVSAPWDDKSLATARDAASEFGVCERELEELELLLSGR